ncbi:MAG: type II toxin-antitoxin system RelE/ParE family toxin [Flavobacteriales bacterium]|nr:type II toxin-antitoxin system RelE/ParE family toxin [Flavobacteriales bacterium]
MTTPRTVIWSALARTTYLNVLRYILEHWSEVEAIQFDTKVESLISKLRTYHQLCPPSRLKKGVRRCVISAHTSLVYKIKGHEIELITFLDNRGNPSY